MSIDPLAEKYQYNSPYAFAENRVVDGRELEGLEWVDSKNNKVYDPSLNDGKGGFTQYATQDHKNLAKSLNQFDTGKEQFNKLVNSTTPVETVLNNKDVFTAKDGSPVPARTTQQQPIMEGTDPDTGEVVDVEFKKSTITFYMKTIDNMNSKLNDGNAKTGDSLNGTKVPEGTNFSQLIGIIFGHEIDHTTKENVLASYKGKQEIEPTKTSDKMINELK